ncbi:DUF3592 domain-containing protein [Silvimonas iriomotensis]|uniref:DUF3592 domain-containing protein n=1 Tax=Silvimonas iriomotensis TaxID=449662 RepID=UPI001663F73F|nr:DUF3592 domain-containing protein [Silvimonas iriomotensis]
MFVEKPELKETHYSITDADSDWRMKISADENVSMPPVSRPKPQRAVSLPIAFAGIVVFGGMLLLIATIAVKGLETDETCSRIQHRRIKVDAHVLASSLTERDVLTGSPRRPTAHCFQATVSYAYTYQDQNFTSQQIMAGNAGCRDFDGQALVRALPVGQTADAWIDPWHTDDSVLINACPAGPDHSPWTLLAVASFFAVWLVRTVVGAITPAE